MGALWGRFGSVLAAWTGEFDLFWIGFILGPVVRLFRRHGEGVGAFRSRFWSVFVLGGGAGMASFGNGFVLRSFRKHVGGLKGNCFACGCIWGSFWEHVGGFGSRVEFWCMVVQPARGLNRLRPQDVSTSTLIEPPALPR